MGLMNKVERAKLELPVVAPETKKLEPTKTAATNFAEETPSRKPSNAIPCSSKAAHYTCPPPKRNLMSSFQAASSHTAASKRQQVDMSSSAVPPVEHMVSRVEALMMPDSPLVAKVRQVP